MFTYDPAGYGRLLSVVLQGGIERFLVFDALGSADRLLAVNQSVTDQYLYEAFGKEVKTGTTRNPFRWLGQIGYYTDNETAGVPIYVRARQYSPVQGRWLSVDPIADDALIYFAYAYVGNHAIGLHDPSGLSVLLGSGGCKGPPPCCLIKTAPPPTTTAVGPAACVVVLIVAGKFIFDWVCSPPEAKKKKCKLIGSGGWNGKDPKKMKRCTYDCGPDGQVEIKIKCPPGKDPPCDGWDGKEVEM